MSKQGLVPTPTVDKNGKSTTVYRKTPSSAAVKPLPVPKLAGAKRGAQKPSTPLPTPRKLTEEEYLHLRNSSNYWLSVRFRPNREEAALLRRIRESGHMSDDALISVSGHMGIQSIGERVPHFNYNAFLLAERVCREEGPDFLTEMPSIFMDSIEGLARRRWEADNQTVPLIETEEELEGHAAVVMLLMVAADTEELENPSFKREEFKTADGTRHTGIYFKSHAFTALLRERPEDYRRIESYVRARSVPRTKADVELLREYLDSENAVQPLVEGWL
jgi:hypothetical protein